jgi:hypothetical protein
MSSFRSLHTLTGLFVSVSIRMLSACQVTEPVFALRSRPGQSLTAHSRCALSTPPCRISAPTRSITSSSSTLHTTLLAASPHSRSDTTSAEESERCRGGTRDGMAQLLRWRSNLARADHAYSAERRSVDTYAHPSSPPIDRITPSRTRSCCFGSKRGRASSSASKPCVATARRNWEQEGSIRRSEQQMRVSATTHARGSEHRCAWSSELIFDCSVCCLV